MRILIQNVQLIESGTVTHSDISVENGKISAVSPAHTLRPCEGDTAIDGGGLYLSHGFIDIHVHGGGGHDFMDATPTAYHDAAALHLRHGTTGMVPTTLAADTQSLLAAFDTYNACKNSFGDGAKFFGVHVEGPYLSPSQCGAQNPAYLRAPNPAEYRQLVEACPDILRWTIAPELPGALEMGDWLSERGIMPSIGHSSATIDEVKQAVRHGFKHVTHLYSAMSTIVRKNGFRRAGIVESAYLIDALTSEIIADGCHLPPELLQMAYRFIGPDRLCLVTDAMRGAGLTHGDSILGSLTSGQRVIIEDGVAKMPDRKAFAGSVCTTDRLVRTMAQHSGATLAEAVYMATAVPARLLGLADTVGTVAPGRTADLVLFDNDVSVRLVMTDGVVRFHAAGQDINREEEQHAADI